MGKDIEKAVKPGILRNASGYVVLTIALIGLILVLQHGNYLLFHSFVEIFSIVIAGAIFIFAWHRHIIDNNSFIIIGIAYLFIGIVDLLHTLAYAGMGVFPAHGANLATQLWILARFIEGSSFVLAAILIRRKIRADITLLLYTAVVALALMSIFTWNVFPTCYIEGAGLTAFKVASEYVISAMLAAAIWLFWRNKDRFDRDVLVLLTTAIAVTVVSEMSFTLYTDVYGIFNAIGHFMKVISFYLIYQAILVTGLEKPYEVFYKKLKDSEELLQKERDFIQNVIDTARTIVLRLDLTGSIVSFNKYFEEISGYRLEEVQGRSWFDIFTPQRSREQTKELFQQAIRDIPTKGKVDIIVTKQGEERYIEWHDTTLNDPGGEIIELLSTGQDVTERQAAAAKLKASEDRFQVLYTNSPYGILICELLFDEEGKAVDFIHLQGNPSAESNTGFKLDQIVGKKASEMVSADILKDLTGQYMKVVKEKKPYRYEQYFDLYNRYLAVTAYPLSEEKFVLLFTDITKTKHTMDALKQSEEFSRSVLESAPNPMTIVNSDTSLEYANTAFEKLLGYKKEEVLGLKAPYPWWPEETRASRILDLDASMRGIFSIDDYVVSKTGERYNVKMNVAQVKYSNGKTGHLAHWTDITELKQLEESLAVSVQEWEKTFDSMPDRICIIDKDYRIIRANKAFREKFDTAEEDVLGKLCYEMVCHKKEPIADCPHLDTLATGNASSKEEFHTKTDAWVLITTSPITDESGKIIANIHVTRDITESKRLEEERIMNARLDSIGTLAGGIAHDFNNLLAIISGNSSLALRLHETEDKATTRQVLEEVEKAALRGTGLTRQLLTFAKGGEPVKKILSISKLLQESADFAIRGSQVKCEFKIADDLRPVECDESQLNQVITNLVINGVQAMPSGGIINISAANVVLEKENRMLLPAGNYIEITVKDHGTGIPKKYLNKIFDPYFSTKKQGNGLGLATSYSIIKNHGGHISVVSKAGAGATFRVYLPAAKGRDKDTTEESAQPALIGKGRILVMDDEAAIRKLLRKILTNTGYEVALAEDGTEAIELYRQAKKERKPFSAVIMDLTIPGGMGGEKTIKELLKIDPKVKAIVSSGYANDSIIANYRKYGFKAAVNKPYTTGEIEKALQDLLAKTK